MKKILLIFILMVVGVMAQQDALEITLIEYNPDTDYSRIRIKNSLDTDLNNPKIKIDSFPEEPGPKVIRSKGAIIHNTYLSEGMHTITVITDEATVSKELSFQASLEEKQAAYEERQLEIQEEAKKEIEKRERAEAMSKDISYKTIVISLGILIIVIGIILYLIKKKK